MASVNEKFIICLCFMLASSTIFVNAGGMHGGGNGGLGAVLAAGLITLLILNNNANQRATATTGYQAIPQNNGLGYMPEAMKLGLLSGGLSQNHAVIPEMLALNHARIPDMLAPNHAGIPEMLALNHAGIPEMLALNQGLNYGHIGHSNALLSNMFAQQLGLLPGNIPLKYGQGMGFNGLGHSMYGLNGYALNQRAFNPSIVPQAVKQEVSPVQNRAVSKQSIN